MIMIREDIPKQVSALLGGRPVRWVPRDRLLVDFDGSMRTLEVFNADPGEQRELLRALRPHRPALEAAAGGPIVVIFHTVAESRRLYSGFLAEATRSDIEPRIIDRAELPSQRVRELSLPLLDRDVAEGDVAPLRRVA
jgi:hypothetical protein